MITDKDTKWQGNELQQVCPIQFTKYKIILILCAVIEEFTINFMPSCITNKDKCRAVDTLSGC